MSNIVSGEWPISNLTNLYKLDLYENDLQEITGAIAEWAPQLGILNLNQNNLAQMMNVSYSTELQILVLNRNYIPAINSSLLWGLINLTHLYLQDNEIMYVDLPHLPSITVLNLARNQISIVNEKFWQNIQNVQELYMDSNQLEGNLNVSKCTKLTRLDADYNMFSNITLATHNQLESINLDGNHLEQFPSLINNTTVPSLTVLDLTRNQISGNVTVPLLPSLTWLSIARNEIESIYFHNGTPLERLYLDYNQLSTVPDLTGAAATIVTLDLDGNVIEYIDRMTFNTMIHLEVLRLAGTAF